MKHNSIPIIFGVTGHRDLRPEDTASLKKSVHGILKTYKDKYPNTEVILISALAEGADMLVAEVAKDLSITLKVVIPYEESEYLNSFENNEAVEQYKSLVEYADGNPTLPPDHDVDTKEKETWYQKLGEYIADTCNILIVLFDGVDTGKKGGTSAIVKYATEGLEDNLFDPLDGNVVCIVNTPRKSNPEIGDPFSINSKYLGMMDKVDLGKMFNKIDEINKETSTEIAKRTEQTLLEKYHKFFDEQANNHQPKYKKSMVLILILTWLAIVFLELMHNLNGVDSFKPWAGHLIAVYAISLISAFFIYLSFMKKGKLQDDFVFSRAFGEATRVQNAWNDVGIEEPISKYYLANQPNKFTWIRIALKNLSFLQNTMLQDYNNTFETYEEWIDGQLGYLNKNIPIREKSIHKIHKYEKPLFWFGIVTLLIMFAIYLLETFHFIHHGHFPFNWHFLVLISGLSLLSAGFIDRYSKIEGHQEDLYNFQIMQPNYKKAKELLARRDITKAFKEKVILDLGKKALEENSKWVELHDNRRAKPELE